MNEDLAAFRRESAPSRGIYTLTRLNREVRIMLEAGFPLIWVEGEISNLARPTSGHLYFSLKDAQAQVRCALFRTRGRQLGFMPENGMQVMVRARVTLYEPRGDYQLIIEQMEEAGDGALRRAFEHLKKRLAAEGLFDTENKRPIPALPGRIGVITSPTGAAIRDVLSVLRRRFPAIPAIIYPVPVQGVGAAQEIAQAIELAARRNECDVLILARGGGSLEDLWAFNEECVARALYACPLPVVTGIGHEIDFTIADFVADRRAPTPSGAAELVSPDRAEWLQQLDHLEARLTAGQNKQLSQHRLGLRWLTGRLRQQHPGRRLQQQSQRVDEMEQRLHRAIYTTLRHQRSRLGEETARLQRHTPIHRIRLYQDHFGHLAQRLNAACRRRLEGARHHLESVGRALDAVSPLATLERGYAIVRRLPDGKVIRSARQAPRGTRVEARLAQGRLICDVAEALDPDNT